MLTDNAEDQRTVDWFGDLQRLNNWMDQVIDTLQQGIAAGQSPFAAGIFHSDGRCVVTAHNTVRRRNQISRHGEVNALDEACRLTGRLDLSGLILVTTGEPCPMCAATAAMAKVDGIVYGASCSDILEAGYKTLELPCEEFFRHANRSPKIRGLVRRERCRELLLQNRKDAS
ncbi:nucleoside deaminase [Crateriforma conspicua]|uniref:Guanine deaminase n=1 Tax=Crateriforma conspicua TaxID=2527996 RepID=A0A5C6FKC5_9PLAN|nr:nucleoside deaminase [Crateriforma conspicua]TWU61879.1 Guanine deaminase [Crateriforma conspicua]